MSSTARSVTQVEPDDGSKFVFVRCLLGPDQASRPKQWQDKAPGVHFHSRLRLVRSLNSLNIYYYVLGTWHLR